MKAVYPRGAAQYPRRPLMRFLLVNDSVRLGTGRQPRLETGHISLMLLAQRGYRCTEELVWLILKLIPVMWVDEQEVEI